MSFREELKKLSMDWFVEDQSVLNVDFKGWDLIFYRNLVSIIKQNKRVLIYSDKDVDGAISTILIKKFFDLCNFTNYEIDEVMDKHHGIKDTTVRKFLPSNFDVLLIVDSSTNEIQKLNRIGSFGKKVIVLDHHVPNYSINQYHKNVLVINTKLIDPTWEMSAGALISLLFFNFFMKNKQNHVAYQFLSLGAITIYSDCCIMDKLNVGIAQEAFKYGFLRPPKEIVPFMNTYDCFCRSFFNFRLNNRINALYREEKFDLINSFLNGNYKIEEIEQNYQNSKMYTQELIKNTKIIEYNKICIGVLPTEPKAKNYTGMVANDITTQSNKLGIVVHYSGKGSVRDCQQRHILKLFKPFFKCGGHKSAFGFFLDQDEYKDFKLFCNNLDNILLYNKKDKNIILNDVQRSDIGLMADFNEVSNVEALFTLKLDSSVKVIHYEKNCVIKWGTLDIISFSKVNKGDTVHVKPIISREGVKLIVVNVL